MNVWALMGLFLVVVIAYLGFSQVSTLETALEGVFSSGSMNLLVNRLTFFFLLIIGALLVALAVVAVFWAVNNWH